MKGRFLLPLLVALVLALPVQATPLSEGGGDDPTPASSDMITIQAAGEAFLYPTATAPSVGRVEVGDQVAVKERLGTWYRIAVSERALGRPAVPLTDGWVTEHVFGQPLDGVPPASGPTPTPTTTATPSSAPMSNDAGDFPLDYGYEPPSIPDVLPGSGSGTPTAAPDGRSGSQDAVPHAQVIIVQQCNDINQNRACDVPEGIAGVVAYVLNARTGEVVGQGISNSRGITQIPITTLRSEPFVLNVPFLDDYQSLTSTDGRTEPIIVDNSVGVSGLLP